jgi:hypothetical protein
VEQSIQTVAGQTLHLVVRPEAAAKGVRGYLVLHRGSLQGGELGALPLSSLVASPFFAAPELAALPKPVEENLVLSRFDYADPDGDGLFTAEVASPVVAGNYDVVTLIEYESVDLGTKELRLVTVVDPEGYVYEKVSGKELRVPAAVVSLYWLNPATKSYELWPAGNFQQSNPQVTDQRGSYSFLVPPGGYYLTVTAPGYKAYQGKPFLVEAGSGVHTNIELTSPWSLVRAINWQVLLLIIVIGLLGYHFYRDKIKAK